MISPAVSILLPTYNRAYILARAIESVLRQTFCNWELVIIDDGSDDDTELVVQKYLIDARIKFFKIDHCGQMPALNFGLKQASGAVISFLDSDDWYGENHLASGLQCFENNSEIDFVKTKLTILGGRFVIDIRDMKSKIDIEECTPQGTFLIRRQVIDRLGGLPEVEYGADYIFYNLAKQNGITIHNLDMRTYFFDRTGADSVTKKVVREYSVVK